MQKKVLNYENLVQITKSLTHSRDHEEICLMSVEAIKTGLGVKGCSLLLFDKKSHELKVAASYGLSEEYINKGPISATQSIASSLEEGPIAIYDVTDDPRIQYPEEATKEGISSILSIPIIIHDRTLGVLRVYTSEPWEFTLEDINFVQALAQIIGMNIEMSRLYKGYKDAIFVLKEFKEGSPKVKNRRTPYEGVPVSVDKENQARKEG